VRLGRSSVAAGTGAARRACARRPSARGRAPSRGLRLIRTRARWPHADARSRICHVCCAAQSSPQWRDTCHSYSQSNNATSLVGDCRFRRARHVLSRSAETGHPRPARYGQLPRSPARIITRRSRPACGSGVVRLRCARPVLRPRAEILARSGSVGLTVVSRLPTATAGFSVRWADLVAGLRRARRPGLGRRRRFHPPATAPADRTAGEGAVCP
jgi:hypothetical protein